MAKMQPGDPAYWMLGAPSIHSQPKVYFDNCYICRDPEYMLIGMSLCRECCTCVTNKVNQSPTLPINPKAPQEVQPGYGHVPADDTVCNYCGHECSPDNPNCFYYDVLVIP